MNAVDTLKDIKMIDLRACCKHFISHASAKLIRDCKSPEELQMKIEIFGIELDPLLLTELQDGFKLYERATKKMWDYASAIHDMLAPMDKEVVPWPLAISCKHLFVGEEDDIDALISSTFSEETEFQTSENFSRIHAYIKGNKPVYDEVMRCATGFEQAVSSYTSNYSRGQIKEADIVLKNYFKNCAI